MRKHSPKADKSCPYLGLQPFTKEDRDFFFGRDEDQETIAANSLVAPLTILYGASGVGKTSVLQAGVVPFLQEQPDVTVVLFKTWQQRTFLSSLKDEIARAVKERTGNGFSTRNAPLDELLAQAARASRSTLVLILDQFEEYFLYHPIEDADGTFESEFARAVNRQEVDANFLLSMREDGLSLLDRFQGRIPHLFANYLRLEHLDRDAARAAIQKPVDRYNQTPFREHHIWLESGLVETILDELGTGRVALGEAGRGEAEISPIPTKVPIEMPYLQLVMTRLWDEEMRAGSHTLQLATLKQLGGAEKIVHSHLDIVMHQLPRRQRKTAASLFRFLVTPSGPKTAYTANDLAGYTNEDPEKTERVLQRLSEPDVRLLRPVASETAEKGTTPYEIFHDKLGPAINEWQAQYWHSRRRRRGRLLLLGFIPVIVALSVIYFGIVVWDITVVLGILFVPPSVKSALHSYYGAYILSIPLLAIGFILGILWRTD
jgi:hypothetical protein